MLQIRIGIQTASLRLPLVRALRAAKELGAEGVEIDARSELPPEMLSRTGLRQIRKQLEDLQLAVCAVSFRTRRGYNVTEGLERRVDATRRAMQLAYDLGTSVVINQVGRVPSEPQGPEWELLAQVLSDLGHYGQRAGAMLAADTGSESGEDLARLIAALPAGSLGVNFSPGNLIVNGFSAFDAARALSPYVLHVHANDAVRDLARGRGRDVPLGQGAAEIPELLAILEEQQYRGFITVQRETGPASLVEIAQSVRYLRSL